MPKKVFHLLGIKDISQKDVLEQLGWPLDELKALTFEQRLGMHVLSNQVVANANSKKAVLKVVK